MLIASHDAQRVVALVGLGSIAMLDYLERSGVFIPSVQRGRGRGKRRRYTFRDVLVLKTLKALLDNGVSVAVLRNSLENFQKIRWSADEATLENRGVPLRYLIASKGKVLFARSKDELIGLTTEGQLAFSFVIDLEKIHTDLCQSWRQGSLALIR